MQSFRNINNIKYDQIKKLRNFVNSSEAFLVCISAFDTTGSKTADKVFLDCDKKNNNWHCCKQRGCKQILPFHHIVAIEDCNTDCQRFQDICRNQCQSNGIFVPGVDEYENQGSNDTRCCYRKKDTDQAETFPQPSTVAACSISGEMEIKVPRSSQIANAWLNAALINTSPTRLSVMPKVDMIL